jgi:cytochrome c-type biogenesis protein CcmH
VFEMIMFWVFAAALCGLTVAALLSVRNPNADSRSDGALAIYKDQLSELDREVVSGAVAVAEADGQRIEISRRLLEAGRDTKVAVGLSRTFPRILVLLVPAVALVFYYYIGDYGRADVPRAERLAAAETSNDWEAMLARVEQQLDKNPNDVEGWQLLIPNYLNMGRYADAAHAIDNVIRINGPTAELYSSLAEALVFENKGLMTAPAIAIVREALKLDPKHPKALYYRALELVQEGKVEDAKSAFTSLLAQAPPGAPWRKNVEQEIAKLAPNATAPQISSDQINGAANMAPADRLAMIRGMVDGLDEKLKANPNDIEGWLRVIRARTVLNDVDKAVVALATARTTFATNADNKKLIEDLAKELNLK